jgi:GT2 family glycosyltransferase
MLENLTQLLENVDEISKAGKLELDESIVFRILVVIPVYNNASMSEKCIRSVFDSEPLIEVLVVNDCSTEPEVILMLNKLKLEFPMNFNWISTRENSGFPAAANLGISHAKDKHVLLVNSDVIVGPKFASLMARGLEKDGKVGSITALTNAGEVGSIPSICEDLILPENSILKSVNQILSRTEKYFDLSNWPEVPSGVGYCMLLSAEALRRVGLFNEEVFSPGYGEENDWSQRAIRGGYQNLLCPMVFVHHLHGETYGEFRNELIEAHTKVIDEMYPTYASDVQAFIKLDPLHYFRQAVFMLAISRDSEFSIILVFDHQLGGGAVASLDKKIKQSSKALFIIFSKISDQGIEAEVRFRNLKPIKYKGTPSEWIKFLQVLSVTEATVNTLAFTNGSNSENAIQVTKKVLDSIRCKKMFLVHDYHSLCPSLNLINYRGSFCDTPNIEVCNRCLPRNSHSIEESSIDIGGWRENWTGLLNSMDEILTFSEESRQRIIKNLPGLNVLVQTQQPDGVLIPTIEVRSRRALMPKRLRLGVPGRINYAKGSTVVKSLSNAITSNQLDHTINIFGHVNQLGASKGIKFHGEYLDSIDLALQMKQQDLDLILIPSICPETYCFVADEVSELGIPVVIFNVGAPAERFSIVHNFYIIREDYGLSLWHSLSEIASQFYSQESR